MNINNGNRAERLDFRQKKIKFYITERCNEGCVYCPIHDPKKELTGKLMSVEQIGVVADEAIALGYTTIKLSSEFGEPLLRDDIVEIVNRCNKSKPHEIGIATNGLKLGEKLEALLNAGVNKLCISLDSLDPNKYKRVTGIPKLEIVRDVIERSAKRLGKKVKVNVVVMKGVNVKELDKLRKWIRDIGATTQLIEICKVRGMENVFKKYFYPLDSVARVASKQCLYSEEYKPRKIRRYFMPDGELLEITATRKARDFHFGDLRLLVHPNGDLGNYDVRKTGFNVANLTDRKTIRKYLLKAAKTDVSHAKDPGVERWLTQSHFVS